MDDEGYQGGLSRSSRWGCAAAVFVAGPLGLFLLIADALGDCIPEHPCSKGFLLNVALPTIIAAVVTGFSVRAVVDWWERNDG